MFCSRYKTKKGELAAEWRSHSKTPFSVEGSSQSFVTPQPCVYSHGSVYTISLNSLHLSVIVILKSLAKGPRTPVTAKMPRDLVVTLSISTFMFTCHLHLHPFGWGSHFHVWRPPQHRLSAGVACRLRSNFTEPPAGSINSNKHSSNQESGT